jgi:hypothetical protein
MAFHLFAKPGAVEQENPARIDAIQQIVFVDIGLLGTGNKIRVMNKIRRGDRALTKTQMRQGYATGFFES